MIALFAAAMVALPAVATATPGPTGTPSAQLAVSPASLALNPAQQRVVSVTNAGGAILARLDANLVTINVDLTARTITVTATNRTGSDVLHVSDDSGAQVDVPIRVALNAGTIAQSATLKVTGNPVDASWLNRQIIALVQRSTGVAPGARAFFGQPAPAAAMSTYVVPVQINGNGEYFDQSDSTNITVQDVPIEPFTPPLLLYDDDPEHITQDGVLFRGTVSTGQPVRLYYYHDNTGDPRRLVIVFAASQAASMHVVESPAGPNIDVMTVGHAVTRNFLVQKPRNEGVVVDLQPDTPYIFHDVSLSSRAGTAGNLDARIISGGPVTMTVLAVSPSVNPLTLLDLPRLPSDGHNRSGTFDIAHFGNDAVSYNAGGADATFVYGDQDPSPRNINPNDPGKDIGDYGVWHAVAFTLTNPTDQPAIAYLYERPIGGVVRSSFLVDGQLIELGCVRASTQRYQIGNQYALAPRQTYRLLLQTMSDGGSNYPLEIGITATPPNPLPPPISAPDGCFPKP